jgi:hypothetical protein
VPIDQDQKTLTDLGALLLGKMSLFWIQCPSFAAIFAVAAFRSGAIVPKGMTD